MKCPFCCGDMEKGLIQSPQELSWFPGEKRRFFGRASFHKGAVTLSEYSFTRGSAVTAYLCRECRKIVIDYLDVQSDMN